MLIKQLFVLNDSQRIFVHIESFNWDFKNFGPVLLDFGDYKLRCIYTAFSNQNNHPVLELAVQDSSCNSVEEVKTMFNKAPGEVFLRRFPQETCLVP